MLRPSRAAAAAIPAFLALFAGPAHAQGTGDADSWPAVSAASPRPRAFGHGVVEAARRHLGTPYRWGGETPRAFDCSGFVRWVFAERGVAMPRTAREQAGVGDAPYPGDLQPGDLLFFYGKDGAGHVAIYVGRDSIIHESSRSRRVQVDSMRGTGATRDWFGRRLIAVRRVRPAPPSATAAAQAGPRIAPATATTIFAGGAQ